MQFILNIFIHVTQIMKETLRYSDIRYFSSHQKHRSFGYVVNKAKDKIVCIQNNTEQRCQDNTTDSLSFQNCNRKSPESSREKLTHMLFTTRLQQRNTTHREKTFLTPIHTTRDTNSVLRERQFSTMKTTTTLNISWFVMREL